MSDPIVFVSSVDINQRPSGNGAANSNPTLGTDRYPLPTNPFLPPNATAGQPLAPYSPQFWAEPLHNYPRLVGDNQFSTSETYIRGLAYTAIPWLGAAAGVFVLFLLSWLTLFCCRGKEHFRGRKIGRKTLILWSILLAIAITGCALMIIGAYSVTQGLEQVYKGLRVVVASIDEVVYIFNELKILGGALDRIAQSVSDQCLDATITSTMISAQGQIQQVMANTMEFEGQLTDITNTLVTVQGGFVKGYDIISPIVYAVAGVTLAITLLLAVTAYISAIYQRQFSNKLKRSPNRSGWKFCSRLGCWIVLPLSLLASCLCLIYIGAMLGINMAAADVCVDPENNIKSVLSGADQAFADLYMYCRGPQEEALRLVAQSSAEFTSQVNSILKNLELAGGPGTLCKSTDIDWDTIQSLLRNQTRLVVDQSIGAAQLLSCKRLNKIYTDSVHTGLCDNGGSGALMAWFGSAVAGASLLALVIILVFFTNPFLLTRDNTSSPEDKGNEWSSPSEGDRRRKESELPLKHKSSRIRATDVVDVDDEPSDQVVTVGSAVERSGQLPAKDDKKYRPRLEEVGSDRRQSSSSGHHHGRRQSSQYT